MVEIKIGERVFRMNSGVKIENSIKRDITHKKIPEKFRNVKIEDFEISNENKKIILGLKNYADKFEKYIDKSILLIGKVGTGKTMIASLILKTILENGFTGEFATTVDMLDKIRNSYNPAINSDKAYMDKLCKVDLLVLDDIGIEKMTEKTYEIIYKVINTRYNKMKATIFTSNCDLKQLIKVLDERLVSRIAEMTKNRIFNFQNKDWRIKNV